MQRTRSEILAFPLFKGCYFLELKAQYFFFLHGIVETNTDFLRVHVPGEERR